MKMDAQPLHHRIVLNHQFEQHSMPIISRNRTADDFNADASRGESAEEQLQ